MIRFDDFYLSFLQRTFVEKSTSATLCKKHVRIFPRQCLLTRIQTIYLKRPQLVFCIVMPERWDTDCLCPLPHLSSNAWVVRNLKARLFVQLSRAFSSVNKTKVLKCKFTWQSTMLPFSPTGNNYLYGHTQLLNKANVIITVILHGCVGTCQFSHTCLERNMRLLPVKAIRALEGQLRFQETRLLICFHSFQITVV